MKKKKSLKIITFRAVFCLMFVVLMAGIGGCEKKKEEVRTKMKDQQAFTGFAELNGTKIYFEIAGEGPPIILLHAGLVDSRMWDCQFRKFTGDYKVIRFDARGFGKSETPDKPFSPVKDVYDLMKFLKMEKAHIMGCSMGGSTALEFALDYPHMVDRLILVGPGARGFKYSRAMEQKAAELYSIAREKGTQEAVRVFLEDPFWSYGVPSGDYPEARKLFEEMVNDNRHIFDWYPNYIEIGGAPALERASSIKIPTLIIVGDGDLADTLAAVEALLEKVDSARKVIIPGAGHMVNMEKPEAFNKIVLEFLKGGKDI